MSHTAYRDTIFSLEGRLAVVTGAAGHLGRNMAGILARAGATVVLVGRNRANLDSLCAELRCEGMEAIVVAADLQQPEAMPAIVASVEAAGGRLDILVNNAYSATLATLETATDLDYLQAYAQTVTTAARLVQNLSPHLKAARPGGRPSSVINICSMYALVSPDPAIYASGEQNPPHYGPAKAALLQWTRYAAVHMAPYVRVNAISPGPFPAESVQTSKPDFVDRLARKTAAGRIGAPTEIEGATLFLASDASSYVTGANLVVDGGWTAW